MPVPSDTVSEDLLELPNWYCTSCNTLIKGELDEDIFLGVCRCERKWYIQVPKRAGYYIEANLRKRHEREMAQSKSAS